MAQRLHLRAVAGYVLLTSWVLWPAIADFRTRVLASDADGAVFTWLWGAMPDAIAAGEDPFHTDLMFHPVGADLRLTTAAPLVAALSWPIREVLGPEAQVNSVQLASMFLAGFALYLLALRVCSHRGAAFVAGMGYALLPNRIFHATEGHLNLVGTAVLPFGLLLFLRFVDAPSWRRAVALGAGCGAAFLVDPQLAIFLAIGLLALAVVHRDTVAADARKLLAVAGVAVLVAAPLLVPMAAALTSGQAADPDPTRSTLVYSASPLSWVVPPMDRLWIGHAATLEPLTPTSEGVVYPGLVLLGLAMAGVSITATARRRGWVTIALVAFVLSLGPYLFVRNTSLQIPLPFFLVRLIPGLDTIRVPGRFGLLGAVGVYVLAALALADLARRIPRRAATILVVAGAVTLVELFPRSVPVRDDAVPAAYEAIAASPSRGAVLEIPLKWSTTQAQIGFEGNDEDFRYLLYQTVHERPTVSGAVSRYPDADLEALLAIPTYRQVLALGGEPGFTDPPAFDGRDLAALGIGFVVYHRDDPAPPALRYLRSLDLPVLIDDGTVIVWTVDG